MSFFEEYKSGNLVFPSALLFHFKDIFTTTDDFLVWQFYYLQNTTKIDDVMPSQIANALGKTVAEVNKSIANLTSQDLLDMKTIELSGEIETIFDASPALAKLDALRAAKNQKETRLEDSVNHFQKIVGEFERELGRFLSPFELEDLEKTIKDDKTDIELVREALKEAVFNGKANWKYIQAILRNWRKEGITNLYQIEERRREREGVQKSEHALSDDFLTAMNLWSDQ